MAANPCHDFADSYYLCSRLLFARRRQVGAAPMRHFRRHADAFVQRLMQWMVLPISTASAPISMATATSGG